VPDPADILFLPGWSGLFPSLEFRATLSRAAVDIQTSPSACLVACQDITGEDGMTLEYVTGAEFILTNDSIIIFVLNTDELAASTRVLVFENGGGAVPFADTGVLTVAPTATEAIGVSLLNSGFYWLKIYVSSNDLVPNVHFVRVQGGQPVTFSSYAPGDFAVFERNRR
jgi:hypothetical protein